MKIGKFHSTFSTKIMDTCTIGNECHLCPPVVDGLTIFVKNKFKVDLGKLVFGISTSTTPVSTWDKGDEGAIVNFIHTGHLPTQGMRQQPYSTLWKQPALYCTHTQESDCLTLLISRSQKKCLEKEERGNNRGEREMTELTRFNSFLVLFTIRTQLHSLNNIP